MSENGEGSYSQHTRSRRPRGSFFAKVSGTLKRGKKTGIRQHLARGKSRGARRQASNHFNGRRNFSTGLLRIDSKPGSLFGSQIEFERNSAPDDPGLNRMSSSYSKKSIHRKVSLNGDQVIGVVTGIGNWLEVRDNQDKFLYFYNEKTKLFSHKLPLQELLRPGSAIEKAPQRVPGSQFSAASAVVDDWVVQLDPYTGFKKFFRSESRCIAQYRMPDEYAAALRTLPYFSEGAMHHTKYKSKLLSNEKLVEKAQESMIEQVEISSADVLDELPLADVLQHPTTCAGFHRYLVAIYAEENLMFFGACEIFEKGIWHGQTVLGGSTRRNGPQVKLPGSSPEQPAPSKSRGARINAVVRNRRDQASKFLNLRPRLEEGQETLYNQLQTTRASIRMGLTSTDGALMPLESMKARAMVIYEKFMRTGCDLWVCVSDSLCKQIQKRIDTADENTNLLGLFTQAQSEVYENMMVAMYPDFAKAVVDRVKVENFSNDEVVKTTLIDLVQHKRK